MRSSIATALALLALGAAAAPAGARLAESPAGDAMVVAANLREAGRVDASDPTDMRRFAERLAAKLPYAPDLVLTSETFKWSVGPIARQLSEVLGYEYRPVTSGRRTDPPGRTDTAVFVNAATMDPRARGYHVPLRQFGSDTTEGAWVRAAEKNGKLRVVGMSLHIPTDVTEEQAAALSADFAEFVDRRFPSQKPRQVEVIGGDFNERRCRTREETLACEERDFYRPLTQGFHYTDSVLAHSPSEIGQATRIDYVFARGISRGGASDLDYAKSFTKKRMKRCKLAYDKGRHPSGCDDFYSDHRFLWGQVGK